MTESVETDRTLVALDQLHAKQLRLNAIMLIWRGFRRLDAASLIASEEDDITGELIRVIEIMTEESDEEWTELGREFLDFVQEALRSRGVCPYRRET